MLQSKLRFLEEIEVVLERTKVGKAAEFGPNIIRAVLDI